MRGRIAVGLLAGVAAASVAQPPRPERIPAEPNRLPPGVVAPADGDTTVKLPFPERPIRLDPVNTDVWVRRNGDGWQVCANQTPLADFGRDQGAANEYARVVRQARANGWVKIGSPRTVAEYGLTDGQPVPWSASPRASTAVDPATVRAEAVRGAWCVRDDSGIVVNCGPSRADAEQTAAVVRKYRFNRVGQVGPSAAMLYVATGPAPTGGTTPKAVQEQSLTRTGLEVPGVGFVGERVLLDPAKVEVRRDARGTWVLAHGADVLAEFGGADWVARDALRAVRDGRFTEFCRVGGVTFFLANGRPPTKVPFAAQGQRFDPAVLTVRPTDGGRFGVYEGPGRLVFAAATEAEATAVVKTVQAFGFDQTCQLGHSPRASLKFLAKVR